MIAEPYICIKGPRLGEIRYAPIASGGRVQKGSDEDEWLLGDGCKWQEYADFEREKLKAISDGFCISTCDRGALREDDEVVEDDDAAYVIGWDHCFAGKRALIWYSHDLIGYTWSNYCTDSESSRLLKRAEFLKAVCEKEGVEWLPAQKRFQELNSEQRQEARNGLSRQWCGQTGSGHVVLDTDTTETCRRCGHVGQPQGRDYYTKAEVDAMKEQFFQSINNLSGCLMDLNRDVWKHMAIIHKAALGKND